MSAHVAINRATITTLLMGIVFSLVAGSTFLLHHILNGKIDIDIPHISTNIQHVNSLLPPFLFSGGLICRLDCTT